MIAFVLAVVILLVSGLLGNNGSNPAVQGSMDFTQIAENSIENPASSQSSFEEDNETLISPATTKMPETPVMQSQTPELKMEPLPGEGTVRLTFDNLPYYMPSLSPDQSRMVAFAEIGDFWQIVEIDPVNGGMVRQITDAKADHFHPHFSSNGDKLLVSAGHDGLFNIHLLDSFSGEYIQKLTDSDSSKITPYWMPGENRFVFMSNRDGDFDVYIGNIDGSKPKKLTKNTDSRRDHFSLS